jgi:hypothetical protein
MDKEEAILATKKIPKNLESAINLIRNFIIPLLPKPVTKK